MRSASTQRGRRRQGRLCRPGTDPSLSVEVTPADCGPPRPEPSRCLVAAAGCGKGQSRRDGGELEYWMAGRLLDELLHGVVTLAIEERGGYPHVANVTLEDGTGCSRIDLLGMERLRPPTMAKCDLRLGTHVVNPGDHSVGRHKPSLSIAFDQDHWCSPLLPSPTSRGGQKIRGLAADAEANQRLHENVDRSTDRPELVGLRHRHSLPGMGALSLADASCQPSGMVASGAPGDPKCPIDPAIRDTETGSLRVPRFLSSNPAKLW